MGRPQSRRTAIAVGTTAVAGINGVVGTTAVAVAGTTAVAMAGTTAVSRYMTPRPTSAGISVGLVDHRSWWSSQSLCLPVTLLLVATVALLSQGKGR